ncbi:ABC transporter permease [Patescibacteria group bacterium]
MRTFKGMVKNIIDSKELIWQLFLRNFKSRYKQSFLGWAWIFLLPIVTMGTFLLLNMSGVIKIGDIPAPYPIYGLLGVSIWGIFSNGWLSLTDSITSAEQLVTKINFPKESLVISSYGHVVVDFLIRLLLVLIVFLVYGLRPSLLLSFFPIFILPLILLTLGLGFITSVLNVIVRDTKKIISVGMNFFLFLMPIMYTIPEKGLLSVVNKYNPIYFLINTPRDVIISGNINNPVGFVISAVFSLFIFFIGWYIFYISQFILGEKS